MAFLWVGSQIPLYITGSVLAVIYTDVSDPIPSTSCRGFRSSRSGVLPIPKRGSGSCITLLAGYMPSCVFVSSHLKHWTGLTRASDWRRRSICLVRTWLSHRKQDPVQPLPKVGCLLHPSLSSFSNHMDSEDCIVRYWCQFLCSPVSTNRNNRSDLTGALA